MSNNEIKTEVSQNKETQIQAEPEKIKSSISDEDLEKLYWVEFKSQSYASFFNTTMEKDKSILTLSVAGIGFLVTFLNSNDHHFSIVLYVIASLGSLAFIVTIYHIITIFGKNSDYVLDIINNKDITSKESKLRLLDKRAVCSFYLGILFACLMGFMLPFQDKIL